MKRTRTNSRTKKQPKYKFIRASKNQTRSNKHNLNPIKCPITLQREKQNYASIKNWNHFMKSAPITLFKTPLSDPRFKHISIKPSLDNQCGNIYIFFTFTANPGTSGEATHSHLDKIDIKKQFKEKAHLSFHYLKSSRNKSCKCWNKNTLTKNRTGQGSNIHYKIDTNKEHPIYIPIYSNSQHKFTYSTINLKHVPSQHKMILDWIIQTLNNSAQSF